ncbi:MAG TPA: hypothetical protein VFE52_03130 [Devosia sp.]|jgi:hypothetical protein|nr:hypothetical protein [Devosia sp.]
MSLHGGERSAARTSPMQIAHNPLFTAREKIDLLNQLKAEVTGETANSDHLGYDPAEIDAAIQEIKLEVQDGDRPRPALTEVVHDHIR